MPVLRPMHAGSARPEAFRPDVGPRRRIRKPRHGTAGKRAKCSRHHRLAKAGDGSETTYAMRDLAVQFAVAMLESRQCRIGLDQRHGQCLTWTAMELTSGRFDHGPLRFVRVRMVPPIECQANGPERVIVVGSRPECPCIPAISVPNAIRNEIPPFRFDNNSDTN